MVWLVVVVVLLLAFALLAVSAFNRLRREDVAVDEAEGGIDVQLTRRADLIPNLVNTVKGYATHEKGVFEEVAAARSGVQQAAAAGTLEDKALAQARLDRAVVNVMAVAEAYPELKASGSFMHLQEELSDTESQLAFARQYYNDAAARLNTSVSTIPWMLFAPMAGVRKREFYDAPAEQQAPPSVQF